jgi:hypothetical protein
MSAKSEVVTTCSWQSCGDARLQGTTEPEAANTAEAASIGDVVIVRYTHSTVLCEDQNDAEQVYLSGELALRHTMRVEDSVWKAIEAERTAQKAAMARLYSCRWAAHGGSKDVHNTVTHKDISGNERPGTGLKLANPSA